jgi:hypothetical protein
MAKPGSVTIESMRGIPTTTAVPPRRADENACVIVSGRPMTSSA